MMKAFGEHEIIKIKENNIRFLYITRLIKLQLIFVYWVIQAESFYL